MSRVYRRKPDAYRDRLTVPMTPELLRRLREFASANARTATAAAREIIEKGLSAEIAAK